MGAGSGTLLQRMGLRPWKPQDMHPQVLSCMDKFMALGMTKVDVYILHSVYERIDADHSGTIEVKELIKHLELTLTPFVERIFKIFDEDNSGQVDFHEFVIAMWNYCTLAKNALIMFAFDLYDNDNSGVIDIKEVELMLKEVYGPNYESSELAKRVLRSLQSDPNDLRSVTEVTAEHFANFCFTHATLLLPAFTLQELLRSKIGGSRLWSRLSHHRFEVSRGTYLNVNQILASHINIKAFNDIVDTEIALRGAEGSLRLKKVNSLDEMDVVIGGETEASTAANSRKKKPGNVMKKPIIGAQKRPSTMGSTLHQAKLRQTVIAIQASGRISERAAKSKHIPSAASQFKAKAVPHSYLQQQSTSSLSVALEKQESQKLTRNHTSKFITTDHADETHKQPQQTQPAVVLHPSSSGNALANTLLPQTDSPAKEIQKRPRLVAKQRTIKLAVQPRHDETSVTKEKSPAARIMEKCDTSDDDNVEVMYNASLSVSSSSSYLNRKAQKQTPDILKKTGLDKILIKR